MKLRFEDIMTIIACSLIGVGLAYLLILLLFAATLGISSYYSEYKREQAEGNTCLVWKS